MNIKRLTESIKLHEGLRLHPYKCPSNKLTIGYGRNLEDKGLTTFEANLLLNNDIQEIYTQLKQQLPYFKDLKYIAQEILIEMAFQIGVSGLLKFKKTLHYLENKDYKNASIEMLNSKWAKQTPQRAKKLSNLMKGE
jgi:lysozyme